MNKVTGYKALVLAMAGVGAMNAHSAGLDRSGQDVTAFLQDGTYAEAVYTYIDTDVSGHDNGVPTGATPPTANYVKGTATGNVTEKYDFFRYGVKADVNDRISVGVLYDEPFGAAVQHQDGGNSNFVAPTLPAAVTPEMVYVNTLNTLTENLPDAQKNMARLLFADRAEAERFISELQGAIDRGYTPDAADTAALRLSQALFGMTDATVANQGQGTNVEIRTNNITGLVGFKLGEQRNIQVYGGAAAQRLTGEVHLRGKAYQQATGYDARISPDTAFGWVAGVSYSKPEIALKASLTYRSEIKHESKIAEKFPALGAVGLTTQDFDVSLPESFNLDFQTGVSPTMLLSAKVRYVPWSDFTIDPTLYTATTKTPIVGYDKDQWSAEIGLGKKLSDKLSVSGNVGYDSGAGNPVSTLGPVKGYYSLGGGFKYNITPNWSASLGAKYLKFGDATAQLPNKLVAGKFEDNDGFIAGLKIAYQAK